MKKMTLALLTFCLLCLSSCSGDPSETVHDAPSPEEAAEMCWVSDFYDAQLDTSYTQNACVSGDTIYLIDIANEEMTGTAPDTGQTYMYYIFVPVIFAGTVGGDTYERLEGYQALEFLNGKQGSALSLGCCPGQDGTLWITTYVSLWYEESTVILQNIDPQGNELARIDLCSLSEHFNAEDINSAAVDKAGNLYIKTADHVSVFNSGLEALGSLKVKVPNGNQDILIILNDGRVALRTGLGSGLGESAGYALQVISPENWNWENVYPLFPSNTKVYAGGDRYLFYCDNGDSLYGYDPVEESFERILSWTGVDIDSGSVLCVSPLEDGRLAAVINMNDGTQIAVMNEVKASELPEKTTLIYATMGLRSDVRADIVEFNKTHTGLRIEVRDYSEYNTADDVTAGLTRLNVEMLTGSVPDLLDTCGLPVQRYGAKGMLEDLWPYLDGDPQLGRDSVMAEVLEAAGQDGKLYQTFSGFSILTAAGSPDIVGDRMGWTLEELQEALSAMPAGCTVFAPDETKEKLLEQLLPLELGRYLHWETGKCTFDSSEFRSLLEFCKSVPSSGSIEGDSEYTRIAAGQQLLLRAEITQFNSNYLLYGAAFGGRCSFIGFPQSDGGTGSCFRTGEGMCMTTACRDKNAAWEFMREAFLPRYPSGMDFGKLLPVNRADFSRMVETAMTPTAFEYDENGQIVLDSEGAPVEAVGWISTPDESLTYPARAITQEEYDQFMALYQAIDQAYAYDGDVFDIILDVAGSYFSGDRSLEDTVDQIQNRVELYISENS